MHRHFLAVLGRPLGLVLFRRQRAVDQLDGIKRDGKLLLLRHIADQVDGRLVLTNLVVGRQQGRVTERLLVHGSHQFLLAVDYALDCTVVINPRHVKALIELGQDVWIGLGDEFMEAIDAFFYWIRGQDGLHRTSTNVRD